MDQPPKESQAERHGKSVETSGDDRFLLFRVGSERYAVPLLEVREIIEAQTCKPVPHALPHFLGVINLRGEITSVIDIRRRLGIAPVVDGPEVFMVLEAENGASAAVVDSVNEVARIMPSAIDRDPHVVTSVPLEFFRGIARHGSELVVILSLKEMLSADARIGVQSVNPRSAA